MQGHAIVARVAVVAVRPPIAALQMHLHGACNEATPTLSQREDRALEVGTAPRRPSPPVNDCYGLAVAAPHRPAQVRLLVPDGGEHRLADTAMSRGVGGLGRDAH